ncbi:hypothetical protein MBLNU457_7793t1 [Dothideomycetes sp. NU457]
MSVENLKKFGIGLLTYYREKGEKLPMKGFKIICHPSVRHAIREEERDKRDRDWAIKALARACRRNRRRRERRRERGQDEKEDGYTISVNSYDSGYDWTSGYTLASASFHSDTSNHDTKADSEATASEKRKRSDSQDSEAAKRPRLTKFNLELHTGATAKGPQRRRTPSVASTPLDPLEGSTSSDSTGIPVEYPSSSSSSSSDNEDDIPPPKRRRLSHSIEPPLPPLPQSFRDLYSTPARLSQTDDPSLHGGRQRLVPHIAGNWSAHVYLEYDPSPTETALLTSLVSHVHSTTSSSITSLLTNSLSVAQPLHISLSAPLVLRTETKDSFREGMLRSLSSVARKSPTLIVKPMSLSWFANAERTRSFLVLRVADFDPPSHSDSNSVLAKLLESSNAVATRFGCKALYTNTGDDDAERDGYGKDAFHISLAWSLNTDETLDESALADSRLRELLDRAKGIRIAFPEVKLRLGKEVSSLPFGRGRKG